jgi:hypothetical protein
MSGLFGLILFNNLLLSAWKFGIVGLPTQGRVMKYTTAMVLFAFTMGCDGSKPSAPTAEKPGSLSLASSFPTTGKPNRDEVVASINEFFSGPGAGFTNVRVETVSDPVDAPPTVVRDMGEAWVCSMTMTCNNVIGDRQQNKNWLVLIGRENGRATVKDYFCNLERIEQSALGGVWFASKGFAAPGIEQD